MNFLSGRVAPDVFTLHTKWQKPEIKRAENFTQNMFGGTFSGSGKTVSAAR
jgi:hypothetical protein